MTTVVGAFEAKTKLSRLLKLVEQGETVVITRHDHPVAKLVPADGRRRPDFDKLVAAIGRIRGKTKPSPESMKDLISAGRKY